MNRLRNMGRRGRAIRSAAALVAFTAVLAACGSDDSGNQGNSSSDGGSGGEQEFTPVDVTFITSSRSIANQMVFTAVDGGFLEDYGINAEVVVAESSSAATAALLSGDAQFMSGSRSEGALAQAGGQDVLYLLKHSSGFSSQVVASTEIIDGLDGDPEDVSLDDRLQALDGKTVALPSEGSVLSLVFDAAMKDEGLSYTPTYIGGDAMPAALEQGSIDAYFFPPPTPQTSIKAGSGDVLIEGHELPLSGGEAMIQAPLYVTSDYLESDRDVVVRVAAAFIDAAEFHRDKPDEAKQLVRDRLSDLDQDVFDLMWDSTESIFTTPLDEPLSEDDVQFIIDNDLKNEPRAADLKAEDIIVPQDVRDEAEDLAAENDGQN